jgi:hypothetical protein
VGENPLSSPDEATENELQVSVMADSKKSRSTLRVTDFKKKICLPTSTLKLNFLMLNLKKIT